MDGITYEKFCTGWLRKHGYHHVSLTRTTGDQGIDILAERHGKSYGFQCKYYERPVGNDAVQQAYTGAAFYGCDVPAVITNSSFTRSAQQLSEEIDVILIDHIDPQKQNHPLFVSKILSAASCFTGIWLFLQYYRHPLNRPYSFQIWSCIVLISSGLCGLYADHMVFCLSAVIMNTLYLIMDLPAVVRMQNIPSALFWCLVLILDGMLSIRLIRMLHQKNIRTTRQMRQDIRHEINDEVREMGKHLEILLEDELSCSVVLQKASHNADGISSLTYQCSRSIQEDLPLLEYSLNQYAQHDHAGDRYVLKADSPRIFTVTISRNR